VDFLLLPENVEQLQSVLLYHVLAGAVPSSDIVPGPVLTLNGATVELAVSDDGAITVNDANVAIADIAASNGIVHVIDRVLLPPPTTTTTDTTTASTDAPAATAVVETCSFCPDGVDNPDLVLPTPDADTCTDASEYALGLAADDSECDYVKGAEALCCPASSVAATAAATTTVAPAGTVDAGTTACSCSPAVYNFAITVGQDCGADTVASNPGIGQTFCFVGTAAASAGRRRLATVSLEAAENERSVTDAEWQTIRQVSATAEIISVQFIEFDTSGDLIVINQDDTYSSVSLANGATVTYTSISSDLDTTIPVSDQLDLVPGGMQLVVKAKVTDATTGEVMIVDNRVAWTYTNECGVNPIEVGEGVAWVTLVSIHIILLLHPSLWMRGEA
jgi:hypothetical protein